MDPQNKSKVWYKSKTIIGIIIGAVFATLAMAGNPVQGLTEDQLVNQIMDLVEVGGVVVGNILAVFGRLTASSVIVGSAKKAVKSHEPI